MTRIGLLVIILFLLTACSSPDIREASSLESADGPVNQSGEPTVLLSPPFDLGAGFPTGEVGSDIGKNELREGQPVPDFTMVFPDGQTTTLSDLKGRAILLNFWATWCGPCRHEIPLILAQQDEHLTDWLVLAVNVKEPQQKVEVFAEEFEMEIPIVLDPKGEVVDLFQVRGFPTSVFLDSEGNLVATWTGVLDEAKLVQLLEASLQ